MVGLEKSNFDHLSRLSSFGFLSSLLIPFLVKYGFHRFWLVLCLLSLGFDFINVINCCVLKVNSTDAFGDCQKNKPRRAIMTQICTSSHPHPCPLFFLPTQTQPLVRNWSLIILCINQTSIRRLVPSQIKAKQKFAPIIYCPMSTFMTNFSNKITGNTRQHQGQTACLVCPTQNQ